LGINFSAYAEGDKSASGVQSYEIQANGALAAAPQFFLPFANHTGGVLLKNCEKGFGECSEPHGVIHINRLWHNLWLIRFQKNDNKGF
jgi:hypothetical protein